MECGEVNLLNGRLISRENPSSLRCYYFRFQKRKANAIEAQPFSTVLGGCSLEIPALKF
jgi:hypothetical protein